jgi:ABC-2 type transport system permease protein
MDMNELYRARAAHFLKEIRPYLHYALQGASVTAGLAFLLISIGYRQFLQWVTPDFPWELLCAAVMAPALAGGRIRTYLQEADILFLLPQESAMGSYLKMAVRRAMARQIAAVTAAWLIVWPVFHKLSPSSGSMFFLLLAVWVVFKLVLISGKRMELHMAGKPSRLLFAAMRWLLSAAVAYSLFLFRPSLGMLILALCSVVYLAVLRIPRKYTVHWSLLIEEEQHHKAGIYRVLNWFVDVPAVQSKARNMHWLDWLPRRFDFRSERAYAYLYMLVWLRSELFGILLRLTAIGVILLFWLSSDLVQGIVYAVVAVLGAVQLADLKRSYNEYLWQHIYPIPPEQRKRSLSYVRLRIHLGMLIVLIVPLFVTWSNPLRAGALLLLSAAASWLYHRFR